ncbi:unnamed protein product [Clonostachys rosea f. rosea IK726]|uniref:BTB domain-containing protein n=2 Tax=Bionectria ochroleuca TaxID=29856 RepID=A0A0B7KLA5_BIOOC|nr:unnamed protein product [Clonostachys rosea f. rosea IK726]
MQMSVVGDPWTVPIAPTLTRKQRRVELMRSVRSLFFTGDYSDCTIICGNYELRMHKSIICPRSRVFAAMFTHGLKEIETGVARLDDEDPEAVRSLLYYMYHLDYPCRDSSGLVKANDGESEVGAPDPLTSPRSESVMYPDAPNLIHHCRVYCLADKFDVGSLKSLAAEKFEEEAINYWDHPLFIEAAREVYATSPTNDLGLRSVVVTTLQGHHQLLDTPGVQGLLRESQLAFDLLMDSRRKGGLYQF